MRYPKCRHELFVAFSCRGRCFCPNCHEKRALEKAGWVAEHVGAEVPHRQFVFTMPKRLRLYFRLIQYFLRCPFSQARMIEVTQEGKVLYKTGDNRLGRFPEAASEDLLPDPRRNFQIFDPLDFLAEVTQHIPEL